MASPSKEENVLKLILENSPLKELHFEEVAREAMVTRAVANKWLKKYAQEGLIKHVRRDGTFPCFTVGSNNPFYYSVKRVYALEQFHKSGLLSRLLSLNNARTVIIFGSMARGDWYKDSDIDIFIYGDVGDFDKTIYELKLGKSIELHIFDTEKDIQDVKTGLIKNVINGYLVKGQIQDVIGAT